MLSWVERPTIPIDLARPMKRRYDDVPPEAITLGRRLLDAILSEAPSLDALPGPMGAAPHGQPVPQGGRQPGPVGGGELA